eukprot:364964-Chlamydomonas_euryale.AAC.5
MFSGLGGSAVNTVCRRLSYSLGTLFQSTLSSCAEWARGRQRRACGRGGELDGWMIDGRGGRLGGLGAGSRRGPADAKRDGIRRRKGSSVCQPHGGKAPGAVLCVRGHPADGMHPKLCL